jgi:DNA-binding transcriptional MerR regulator
MNDYSIEQLEELTGFARRTIRFYIQQGLVEAPFGARKTPRYTQKHVEQLLKVRQYKEAGLNLKRIAQLLTSGSEINASQELIDKEGSVSLISRIQIGSGVTLDIDRSQCSLSDDHIRNLAREIHSLITKIQGASHD